MPHKKQIKLAIICVFLLIILASFISPSSVKANGGFWTGDPDPFDCSTYEDCYWTVIICIYGVTQEVGIYYDPAGMPDDYMVQDAFDWSGINISIGSCHFSYTGRWVHTYFGTNWNCNLISEAGEDKDAARFSDITYVSETCGVHPVLGPFDGTADYILCREKFAEGIYYCGNHYDTSQ